MNILFYTPFNLRSRDTESLMLAFKRNGHRVFFVSQNEGYPMRTVLEEHGIETFSLQIPGRSGGLRFYLTHIFRFARFCYSHKIDFVYSHLEPANFIAAIGQYLVRAKVFICRHHITEAALFGFDKKLYYRLTYSWARKIIVVAVQAKTYMTHSEGVNPNKIIHINLGYDFSLYPKPDPQNIVEIRNRFSCDVLLVFIGRLTPYKRPDIALETLTNLLGRGIHAKLMMLGSGPLEVQLKETIQSKGLTDSVFMTGYVSNPLDYLAAANFLVHPSIAEASCVVTKEAGLVGLPIIVCQGVGDFDSYLKNGVNGFSIKQDSFVQDASDIIVKFHSDKESLEIINKNLKHDVNQLFGIDHVAQAYEALMTSSH